MAQSDQQQAVSDDGSPPQDSGWLKRTLDQASAEVASMATGTDYPMPAAHCYAASALKVGDLVRDNDHREPARIMRVHAIDGSGRAVLRMADPRLGALHQTRIKLDRFYTDGKSRKSGWSVVQ